MACSQHSAKSKSISVEALARKGCFEFWQANTAPFCDVTPLRESASEDFFESRHFFAEGAMLNHSRYGAKAAKHTQKHADQVGHIIRIQRFLSGGMIGRQNENPFEMRPGSINIMDQAHMFEALHHPSLSQGLCLSKAMLGIATSETIDFDLMNPNRTYTRLLHAELDRLYTPLLAGAQSIPRPQFERFVACVRMLVHKERQEDDVRTQARDALRDLICDHIEHRLASADLSADSLLSEFGVSRASLYRMFEADGGVRSYINNRRLFRAVHMISSNPLRRGQVTQAAERWGFNSPVSFNRSVRRVYGTAPGSLFRQPLRPIVTPLYSAPFERFLARSTHHRKSQSRSQPARASAA